MKLCSALGSLLGLILSIASPASAGKVSTAIKQATINQVRECRPLGQVVGESVICSDTRGMNDAIKQAVNLGATHIVWVENKCVIMVGQRATGRIFDCAPKTASLDEVFEDYLASDPRLAARTVNSTIPTRVMTSSNLDADAADLVGRGYVLAGYAGATGGRVPLESVRKKALAVGAEIALVQSRSAGEDVEYQGMTTYSRGGTSLGISTGYVGGTVAGQSVGVGGTGTSVVTNPGSTQTQMVPYSQRRYETQVLFWRKLRAGPLGLVLDLIPAELRQRLSRNTGAYVLAVEDETPAFFANIVKGDVIIAINGAEVRTPNELAALVERSGVSPMKLRILRNLTQVEIEVRR